MNIIIAASEVFPFCKTGGLADVAGALGQVLSKTKGNKVVIFLPRYRNIGGGNFSLKAVPGTFSVPVNGRNETVSLSKLEWGKAVVYFIKNTKYFDRSCLYRTKSGDYQDNDERFIFFARAVLEGAKFIDFKPDIIHCHDWQAGLIPAYLKTLYKIDAFFVRTGTLLTIHNISYQGFFPKETLFKAGFGWIDFKPDKLEYYDGINFLKSGIVYADAVNTVSPSYAKEVKSSEKTGCGLDGILRTRLESFTGILNGIDIELWDPEIDSYIPRGYDEMSFPKGKAAAKKYLQNFCGLKENAKIPMIGIVSRLDFQKGFDVILNILPRFINRIQLAVLGVGDPSLQKGFLKLKKEYPLRVCCKSAMDETLAHRIYAASDGFLMPSRFEPCGLSQMIAMRYGTVPIVTKTGGLADTVTGYGADKNADGFIIPELKGKSIAETMKTVLSVYKDKRRWNAIVKAGMKKDYSWDKSACLYMRVFKKILKKIR